jgi:putative transposase
MPRTARASLGGYCYHVLNRGNNRAAVFHKDEDDDAFVALAVEACQRHPMRVLAYCVMPNHFHLVLWPHKDGDLSRWMQWLLTSHVRRYHRHYGGSGHVWQGRFRAFPIQDDGHLLAVLRYVERNPVRAELVPHAEDWRWSSAPYWAGRECVLTPAAGPVERGPRWLGRVNRALSAGDLSRIGQSLKRGSPLGTEDWTRATAVRMGLEASLRPRGRPRKKT